MTSAASKMTRSKLGKSEKDVVRCSCGFSITNCRKKCVHRKKNGVPQHQWSCMSAYVVRYQGREKLQHLALTRDY